MLLLGIFRLNGHREEIEIWCGASPELKMGFVLYEVARYEGRKVVVLTDSDITRYVVRALHGPEDPRELSYKFRTSLSYYYIKEGRAIYLKRDLYEVHLRGISRGALMSLRFLKGMSRIGYDDLIERIVERAREASLSSRLTYASYPDELDSCR
ncbi:MAG: hypothetical protein NZ992_05630 [Candidatus Korarchaeum sp.]|nr:hypothetical protein [Candidatus Korarchaeum sp.]MDW8034890.1 hypothetical protein [Candidatus Korarchaeum sp.]